MPCVWQVMIVQYAYGTLRARPVYKKSPPIARSSTSLSMTWLSTPLSRTLPVLALMPWPKFLYELVLAAVMIGASRLVCGALRTRAGDVAQVGCTDCRAGRPVRTKSPSGQLPWRGKHLMWLESGRGGSHGNRKTVYLPPREAGHLLKTHWLLGIISV